MKVRLISHTTPAPELFEHGVNDIKSLVAYCARVSNPENQLNTETYNKLINYLIKNKHWSPFELVNVCLEVESTRDITRQMLRHRSFSFNEYSQRYADPTKDLSFSVRDARLQDPKNRQNSIAPSTVGEIAVDTMWKLKQKEYLDKTKELYDWAISNGIAKEQARAVLPEGLTNSRMYVNGTLRSWIHYIEVRSANGTQLEHMELAKECAKVISQVYTLED